MKIKKMNDDEELTYYTKLGYLSEQINRMMTQIEFYGRVSTDSEWSKEFDSILHQIEDINKRLGEGAQYWVPGAPTNGAIDDLFNN